MDRIEENEYTGILVYWYTFLLSILVYWYTDFII